MPRTGILASLTLGFTLLIAGPARPADPPGQEKAPLKPLAELAKDLRDPDREKRYEAAVAIRDHYKGKSLEVLPQLLAAIGDELDRPEKAPNTARTIYLEQTLRQAAYAVGPGRLKVLQESTRHLNPQVRAAAFRAWLKPVNREANIAEDRGDLLAAIRRGLKDESPLARGQAASALRAFWDAPPEMAGEAVSLLAIALDDRTEPREGVRSPAVNAAGALTWFQMTGKLAIPALAKAAATKDEHLVHMSCTALQVIAQADPTVGEQVVKILRPLLSDTQRPDRLRAFAAQGLVGIGPPARWAVPDLADVLEEPRTTPELRNAAYTALRHMGPRAVAAISTLIKRLEQTTDRREMTEIFNTFKAMGPAASPAVEAIESWMQKSLDPTLRNQAHAALTMIKK